LYDVGAAALLDMGSTAARVAQSGAGGEAAPVSSRPRSTVRRTWWLPLVAALTTATIAAPAGAHWSASYSRSLFVERYLVCDGDLDVRCVGPDAARDPLLGALELQPLVADRNNDHIVDPARDAAVLAAYFDMQHAVPALREMLVLPMPKGAEDTHTEMEVHALRAEAAYALAKLGDRQSVAPMVALVRYFETEGHGTLWGDTVAAITELSPTDASAYARDFLGRMKLSDTRMSMPGGGSQLAVLEPILVAKDKSALPVLRALTEVEDATTRGAPKVPLSDSHTWCRLMATRLELGDTKLVDEVRTAFAGSYSGTMVATCDGEFLRAYGSDPRDAEILLRHTGRDDLGFDAGMSLSAYDRIIALVAALRGRNDVAAQKARRVLLTGLRERSKYPHVADETHRSFGRHFVALHRAALAGLGDAESLRIIRAMILDTNDLSGVADLAALRAVQLELPGAIDDATTRMAMDVAFTNDERSGIFEDLRVRLLDAVVVAAPEDSRWAVALIDAELDTREHAIAIWSRNAPLETCDAVMAAANGATEPGINQGFLVLTTRLHGCRSDFDLATRDETRPAKVRGMAFEALAILGVAIPRDVVTAAERDDDLRVHLGRTHAIAHALRR
jgi:hypothetical protein